MIAKATGEVFFANGFSIPAHVQIQELLDVLSEKDISSVPLPIDGWNQHCLGEHASEFGAFAVEVVSGKDQRVEGVFLSHAHDFYENHTTQDRERRIFHEGVMAQDLLGEREFSWGEVFCRLDPKENRDWLVVIYKPFSAVPLRAREIFRVLKASEAP